jgi:Domain of unknown function (DUF4381)
MNEAPAAAADPLARLVDIVMPPPPSLWPQTPASLILIALAAIGLVVAAWWLVRRHRANRYRRAALAELAAAEQALAVDAQRQHAVASLAGLIRRTALAAFSRDVVVPLQGAAWLAFLDRSYGGTAFSDGPGRVLAEAPYRRSVELDDPAALIAVVRQWIRKHHV